MNEAGNLIIVSNRGPNDFVWKDEHWIVRPASGGLVSMIDPLARAANVSWFCCVSELPPTTASRAALFTTAADQTDPEHHIVPVPLPAEIYQDYYGAISNEVLWMLQHHLVGQHGYSSLDAERHRAWREGYLEANRRVAHAIQQSGIKPRAFLIQDYHLYPLPALLRETFPEVPSLHFTHIPFPDSATLKLIPRKLARHHPAWPAAGPMWLECKPTGMRGLFWLLRRVARGDGRLQKRDSGGAGWTLGPRPRFPGQRRSRRGRTNNELARRDRSAEEACLLVKAARSCRQTDYHPSGSTGSEQESGHWLPSLGRLLEMRPDLRAKVRFLAFLVPSRTDLSVYRSYRDAVYASIDEVNTRFAPDCGGDPIKVFYTNDREQALAGMELCDVLLANSREDGMNLVVKEWAIVSQGSGCRDYFRNGWRGRNHC